MAGSAIYRAGLGLLAVLLVGGGTPALGEDFLFSRRMYAYVGLGASGVLFKEAYDARQRGGDLYQRYKEAQTSQQAQELYDETRRYDTRGVVLGVLGAGTLAYSIHILRSQPKEQLPLPQRGAIEPRKERALSLDADPLKGYVGVVWRKRW